MEGCREKKFTLSSVIASEKVKSSLCICGVVFPFGPSFNTNCFVSLVLCSARIHEKEKEKSES